MSKDLKYILTINWFKTLKIVLTWLEEFCQVAQIFVFENIYYLFGEYEHKSDHRKSKFGKYIQNYIINELKDHKYQIVKTTVKTSVNRSTTRLGIIFDMEHK